MRVGDGDGDWKRLGVVLSQNLLLAVGGNR